MHNLERQPVLAIAAERRITALLILNAEEKKVMFRKMRQNGLGAKLGLDPATAKARAKGKPKGKAKAEQEETETGKEKGTAGNHLAPIGPKGMATASGATIVALLMMYLREEKERHRHHWQRKVL